MTGSGGSEDNPPDLQRSLEEFVESDTFTAPVLFPLSLFGLFALAPLLYIWQLLALVDEGRVIPEFVYYAIRYGSYPACVICLVFSIKPFFRRLSKRKQFLSLMRAASPEEILELARVVPAGQSVRLGALLVRLEKEGVESARVVRERILAEKSVYLREANTRKLD